MKKSYLMLIFVGAMLVTAMMALEFNQNHRLLSGILLASILGSVIYTKILKKKDD